ncbi:MAG: cell wall-binding repeat-containing protein, partial [Rhodoglobus sp.]
YDTESKTSTPTTKISPAPPHEAVQRLAGDDRFATSAAISAANFNPGVSTVYIANGYKFPDALSAAPVAGMNAAPVLLVTDDSIPAAVQAELTRLRPGRIVVLGSPATISENLMAALTTSTEGTVQRLAGDDRFATSAAISAANFNPGVSTVYIANGYKFPDALSAAPVAGMNAAPVLLVTDDSIPAAVQAELTRLRPGRIVVLGSPATISENLASILASFVID